MTSIRIRQAAPAAGGLLLASANTFGLTTMPRSDASRLVVGELVVCYAVYVGFALHRRAGLAVESVFAGAGVALAGLAIRTDQPAWLALGWAVHGVWDLLHHRDRRRRVGVPGVPAWYIPLCALYDFPVALSVLLVLGVRPTA